MTLGFARGAGFVAAAVVLGSVIVPGVAAAAGTCSGPQGVYQSGSWAQNLIDAPRIWPLANGTGVTVAVLGTGVDGGNPQLTGQLDAPVQRTAGYGGAADCAGYGTFDAGIVAAQPNSRTTFAGIAPGARILPVRYTDLTGTSAGDPDDLAGAIGEAVSDGANVILIAVPAASDSANLRNAVRQAYNAGDVVVSPAVGGDGAVSYPTADARVLGVGAVNQSGAAVKAESGDYIKLAAPGADLVSTAARTNGAVGQIWQLQDPSFASAAYVAGVVALLKSYRPGLTPAQIEARLTLTATRKSTGQDPQLGWGVLDAYDAVTAELPADATDPSGRRAGAAGAVAPAASRAAAPPPYRIAGLITILGLLVAGGALVAAVTIRRGRARRWRLGTGRVPLG